jgi:hypothetical protein
MKYLPSVADVLMLAGLASIAMGASLIYPPAGWIAAGTGVLGLGVLKALGGKS